MQQLIALNFCSLCLSYRIGLFVCQPTVMIIIFMTRRELKKRDPVYRPFICRGWWCCFHSLPRSYLFILVLARLIILASGLIIVCSQSIVNGSKVQFYELPQCIDFCSIKKHNKVFDAFIIFNVFLVFVTMLLFIVFLVFNVFIVLCLRWSPSFWWFSFPFSYVWQFLSFRCFPFFCLTVS